MFLVLLIRRPLESRDEKPADRTMSMRRRRVWERFFAWMREPIPFPGMTYNFLPRTTRYNQSESSSSTTPRT